MKINIVTQFSNSDHISFFPNLCHFWSLKTSFTVSGPINSIKTQKTLGSPAALPLIPMACDTRYLLLSLVVGLTQHTQQVTSVVEPERQGRGRFVYGDSNGFVVHWTTLGKLQIILFSRGHTSLGQKCYVVERKHFEHRYQKSLLSDID